MSDESPESRPGVWDSLKRVLDTLLATAQNRVELFATELEAEKCRWIEAFLLAAMVAAFGMMALSVVTVTVVLLFWENGRIPALVGLSVLYVGITALAWRALQVRLRDRKPFSGTLGELQKDRSCL